MYYFQNMKNYQCMNLIHTSANGNELWLGDYYAATDLNLLRQKKITYGTQQGYIVLTAAAMLGVTYPKDMGITHKIIKAFDLPTYKMAPHFEDAYQFIRGAMQNGNILIHCAAGISRSATFVLVYLMKEKSFNLNQAMQFVRSKRSIVNPNYGFQNQLSRLEQQLKKAAVKGAEKIQKPQKVSGLSEKKQKTMEQIQQQKNAFLSFVNRESALTRTAGSYLQGTRFKSIGNKKQDPTDKSTTNAYQRGTSVNYRKTINSTTENIFVTKKLNNLTFKLQTPKIVTIKK